MTEDEIVALRTERDTYRDRLALIIEQAHALGHSPNDDCSGSVGDVDCECAVGMFMQMACEVLPPSTTSELTQFVAVLAVHFGMPTGASRTDVEIVSEYMNLAVRSPDVALARVTDSQWKTYLANKGWETVRDDEALRWEPPSGDVMACILVNEKRHMFDVDNIARVEQRSSVLVLLDLLMTAPR